jgi:Na+/melibiose symporter-like transporter
VIVTCKKEVPALWIGMAILPWAAFSFNYGVISVVFLFSLKKFIENPAGLTFILSLPGFVSLFLQPIVSFLSDRIWTRFGRRKPFILTSQVGCAVCLVLMPLMPSFWPLLGAYILYNAFLDVNSPMEPLKQEIIPPSERGRATGAMTWCANFGTLLFYFIALGRFDDVSYVGSFPIRGEMAIYWSGGLLLVVMAMLVALGIREIDQKSALRGERLTVRNFFGGLLDSELWPVYVLVVGAGCLNFYSGLGPLSNLLYTDQWHYTKQEMGINVAIGGIFNLFAIGFLTLFADRLNRIRAYQTLICLSLAGQFCYYAYVNFVLPDKRPSLVEIIVFGETLSMLSILTGLIFIPLIYDYVRRNKMGTFNAGSQVVSKLTILITLNGVGLFVWGYAALFQPPAGEITRVVLRGDDNRQAEIQNVLRSASWTYPGDGQPAPASAVSTTAWQANGTVASTGRCWEVRLHDKASEKLASQRDDLSHEDDVLASDAKIAQDRLASLKRKGKTVEAAALDRKTRGMQARIDVLTTQVAALTSQLDTRSQKFHDQVVRVLGSRIIADGEQILSATAQQGLVLELPTTRLADPSRVKKMTAELAQANPAVIDLRPLKGAGGYGLGVSAILPPHGDESVLARSLQGAVEQIADRDDPGLLAPAPAALQPVVQPVVTLDLAVVERPIDDYVSPINRVVDLVLGLFHDAPRADHRLTAMAHDLRLPTESNYVRVQAGPRPKTLSVTAVLPPSAGQSTVTDALTARLRTLLGPDAPPDVALQSRKLYDRINLAAAAQRITVAEPTLVSAYATMKYDYMSGYIWMFVMGLIGIGLTVVFTRLEARGLIRKRGREEAMKS